MKTRYFVLNNSVISENRIKPHLKEIDDNKIIIVNGATDKVLYKCVTYENGTIKEFLDFNGNWFHADYMTVDSEMVKEHNYVSELTFFSKNDDSLILAIYDEDSVQNYLNFVDKEKTPSILTSNVEEYQGMMCEKITKFTPSICYLTFRHPPTQARISKNPPALRK